MLLLLLLFQCVLQTRLSAQSIFRQSISLKFCASKNVRTCGKLIQGKMCRILCLLVHPQNKGYRRTMARTWRKYTFRERTFFRPPPASNSGSFRQGFSMFFPCKELSFTPLFSHLVLDLGCPLFGIFFRLMGSLLLPVKKVELHRALPCHLHRAQKPSCISRPRQQALALAFHRS